MAAVTFPEVYQLRAPQGAGEAGDTTQVRSRTRTPVLARDWSPGIGAAAATAGLDSFHSSRTCT